jgi:hypothetical protein
MLHIVGNENGNVFELDKNGNAMYEALYCGGDGISD